MTGPLKRSFAIKGHRTSISLEPAFWDALHDAAREECLPLAGLVARIDRERGETNLSSAVRTWLLAFYRSRALPPPTTVVIAGGDQGNRAK